MTAAYANLAIQAVAAGQLSYCKFLSANNTGALFVLIKKNEENYQAFLLNSEDDIEAFLSAFLISPMTGL